MSENYIKSTAAAVPFTSNNEVLGREMEKLKKGFKYMKLNRTSTT